MGQALCRLQRCPGAPNAARARRTRFADARDAAPVRRPCCCRFCGPAHVASHSALCREALHAVKIALAAHTSAFYHCATTPGSLTRPSTGIRGNPASSQPPSQASRTSESKVVFRHPCASRRSARSTVRPLIATEATASVTASNSTANRIPEHVWILSAAATARRERISPDQQAT